MEATDSTDLGEEQFRELLELRTELRRFLHWSEIRARAAGVTPAQHQLLLVVRGHESPSGPTINDVAETLLLKHHSAVELVQRAEVAGLVARQSDAADHRVVHVTLSTAGHEALARLTPLHHEEIRRLRASGHALAGEADPANLPAPSRHHLEPRPAADDTPHAPAPHAPAPPGDAPLDVVVLDVVVLGVHTAPRVGSAWRVLVDRRWPSGVRAEEAPFDEWLASLAPPSALVRAMGDAIEPDDELGAAYRALLREGHGAELDRLVAIARRTGLVLVTSAPDPTRSPAAVVGRELQSRAGRERAGPAGPQ